MIALVTGGTGFVGSHIARTLLDQGHEVMVTGSCPERIPEGTKFIPHCLNGIDWRELEKVDVLFHQAANNNTLDPNYEQMMRANFYASCDLFLALLHHSECKQLVYASSTAVYGNGQVPFTEDSEPEPLNAYAISKLRFDQYAMDFAKKYDMNVVGLRYCNVYGPGEEHKGRRASMVTQLANKIKRGEEVCLFEYGDQRREWIYVKDVVEANMLAMHFEGSGIFNCATGNPYTFREVLDALNEYLRLERMDMRGVELRYVKNPHPETFQNNIETNMSKSQEILGFAPKYDLNAGIRDYL